MKSIGFSIDWILRPLIKQIQDSSNSSPYRVDVTREADVIEEIIRIYGFNNIDLPETLSSSYMASFPEVDPVKMRKEAGLLLTANAYQEIMTNSLTKSVFSEQLDGFYSDENVEILNKLK